MVMILEINFKGSGESLKSFMSLREMIFVIAIQRLYILSLWKDVVKGPYSNVLIGLLEEVPSSFVHGMQRCLSNGKVTGFNHCALPPEGASGLPWSCTILLAHCLRTTWWHWQLAQQLAIFQGQGRYGSWWLVNSVPALCAQAYVQTPLAVLLLEPPASSEQSLGLKSPPPVTIAIT